MTNPAKLRTTLCASTAIAGALLFLAAPAAAQTLPDTGNVTTVTTGLGGAAPGSTTPTFSTTGERGADTLRVDLRDNRTIINWGGTGFNIAAGNTVDFKDSRATSGVTGRTHNIAVLNRVIGGSGIGRISGNLTSDANVAVYVVTRGGLYITQTAVVNTGSFIGSTTNLSNDNDFLNGSSNLRFGGAVGADIVVHEGARITTATSASTNGGRIGDVVLIGSRIIINGNNGVKSRVTAGGDIGLIVAEDVTVHSAPGSPLSFTITRGTNYNDAGIRIAGDVSGRNVTMAVGARTLDGGGVTIEAGTVVGATGASQTDRGVVLTAGYEVPGVAYATSPLAGGNLVADGSVGISSNITSGRGVWLGAANDVNIYSNGTVDAATDIVARAGYSGRTGGGIGSAGTLSAGGKIDLESNDQMLVANATGTHGIRLVSNPGNRAAVRPGILVVGTLSAPGSDADLILLANEFRLRSDAQAGTNSRINLQAGRDLILNIGGAPLLLGTLSAGRNLEVSAGSVDATRLESRSGSVTINGVQAPNVYGGSTSGAVTVAELIASGNITVGGTTIRIGAVTSTKGDVLVTGTDSVSMTGNVSAEGNYSVIGNRVTLGSFNTPVTQSAKGAVTIDGGISMVEGLDGLTLTANSNGTGNEPMRLVSTTGLIFGADTALNAGPNRHSDIYFRTDDGYDWDFGAISARGIYSGIGTSPFAAGINRANSRIRFQGPVSVTDTLNVVSSSISARYVVVWNGDLGLRSTGSQLFFVQNATADKGHVSLSGANGIRLGNGDSLISASGNIDIAGGTGSAVVQGYLMAGGNLSMSGTGLEVGTLGTGFYSVHHAAGSATLVATSGNIVLRPGTALFGRDVILSTPNRFVNNAGSNAVTANGGHWVIYSADPANNVFGGLNSNNTAVWGATLETRAPGTFSGNRYVFAIRPTLTINPLNFTKTYGDDLSVPINQTSLYTITGFHPGVVGAFLGDTASSSLLGAPSISSGGLGMRASVAGGPYPIDIGFGTLTSPSGYALALGSDSGAITVTPKALAITYIANDKFYDGTTAGTGTVRIDGIVAGDTVTAGGTTWTFDGKNAAAGRVVTVAGTTITGADLANYSFTLPAGAVTADILKARLSINISANDKTYDGTVAATGTASLIGVIDGENVTLTGGTLQFASKDAGAGVAVFLQGVLGLSGVDSGNYELGNTSAAQATIFRKALTGTVTPTSKTYDGTANAAGTIVLNGVIVGDSVSTSGSTFTFDDRNAGAGKTVTASGTTLTGADAGNYTLTVNSGFADILKRALTATVTANGKTYDGTAGTTGSVSLNGVIAGDTVGTSGSVFTFDNRNAGAGKTVTVSGTTLTGADAGNYTLTVGSAFADILTKALTGTVTVDSKTYDGTTAGSGTVTLNGVVQGDSVGTTGSVWVFGDKNAGTGKTVTLSGTTLTGTDAGNYSLSLPATALGDILRKALTGTISVDGKTYDGTTNATGTITLNGVVQGDQVGTGGTFLAFADKNAGTGKMVTVSGTTLIGGDAANYTLTLPATAAADILKRGITGTIAADGKTYDGTTSGTGTVTLTGVIEGDTVGTTGSVWTFADKNAGTGKTVTLTGTMLTGADGGNYTLTLPATALADILRKALTGTISANAKTYDGTTTASGSIELNGVVQGDAVGTSGSVWVFSDKNAGTGRTVTLTGTILSGGDAGNYTLTLPSTTLADILRRALVVTPTVNGKTYDGTTSATGSVSLGNVVQGDQVGTTGTAFAFADRNAGTGKTVNVTGTTLTGADSGNYTLSIPDTVLGDILKRAITGTVTADNKTYDGTTNATGTIALNGVVQGDQVGTAGTTWTFSGKAAGTGKTVTISGTTLTGADGGNYTLTLPASALADILKRAITGTVTIIGRQYDGTTAASGTVTLNGVVQGDQVGTTGTVLTYADRNAGTGKAVSVSGTTLNGADAGNYTLTMPASATGDILKRIVGVGADDQSKTRDDEDPILTFTISSGSLVTGDTFSGDLVRASGEAPGTYAITIGTLTLGNNYQISFTPGVFTIELNPASDGLPPAFKALFLPSQMSVPPESGTSVTIDKDDLCGDDAGCVVK